MIISTEKIAEIIEHNGMNRQRFKAAEELSELQTIVLQDANDNGKVSIARLAEEIADVYVILSELELIYNLDDRDIQPIIDFKIDRTLRRIEEREQWETKAWKEANLQRRGTAEADTADV